MTTSVNIQMTEFDKDALRNLAYKLGFIADRGPSTGEGSISALMRAIARGEAVVVKGTVYTPHGCAQSKPK